MNYLTITKSPSQNKVEDTEKKEQESEEPSKEIKEEIENALEKPLLEKKKLAEKLCNSWDVVYGKIPTKKVPIEEITPGIKEI